MKNFRYLIPLFALLVLTACDPDNKTVSTDAGEAVVNTETDKPDDHPSKAQAAYNFTLIPGVTSYEEEMQVPSTDIYLTASQFPEAHLLVSDFNYDAVKKVRWTNYDIPATAEFAFQTWFAGGGSVYYGLLKDHQLELYRRYVDEGLPDEDSSAESPFERIKTIDLKNPGSEPGYFICYQADKQANLQLAIHYTTDGRATSLIYKGQTDYIPLQFMGEEISTEGASPTITQQYLEIFEGQENGKLTLTHSGNWDYASYTRGKDGKPFAFTIDHDRTIVNDTYRTTPCFD